MYGNYEYLNILRWKSRHRKIANICPICLTAFKSNQKVIVLACGHIFHHSELIAWFSISENCPVCKLNI